MNLKLNFNNSSASLPGNFYIEMAVKKITDDPWVILLVACHAEI